MAKKSEKSVTRIKASDEQPAKTVKKPANKKSSSKSVSTPKPIVGAKKKRSLPKPLAAFVGYFVGAWAELRQVHWPTREATWGLTGAVLAFTAFFVIFILILDYAFNYLFEIILK